MQLRRDLLSASRVGTFLAPPEASAVVHKHAADFCQRGFQRTPTSAVVTEPGFKDEGIFSLTQQAKMNLVIIDFCERTRWRVRGNDVCIFRVPDNKTENRSPKK